MIKIRAICRCGLENYTLSDWFAHWQIGTVKYPNPNNNIHNYPKKLFPFLCKHPKIRAIYLFLMTRIEIKYIKE